MYGKKSERARRRFEDRVGLGPTVMLVPEEPDPRRLSELASSDKVSVSSPWDGIDW